MANNKKSDQGFIERKAILHKHFAAADELIIEALAAYPRKALARDDIVDAVVAAVSCQLAGTHALFLPSQHSTDALGLPMRIAYALPE